MDYTPSPSKFRHGPELLDDSIEIGRKVIPGLETKPQSPASLDLQKKFYKKYADIQSPLRKKSLDSNTTTNTRLFKNIGSHEVLVGDNFKVQANMIEKLIKAKKLLQTQNTEVMQISEGLRGKLVKYKALNEDLKESLNKTKNQNEYLNRHQTALNDEIEKLKLQNEDLQKEIDSFKRTRNDAEPEYAFNPDDTLDIFDENLPQPARNENNTNTGSGHSQQSKCENDSRLEMKIDHFLNEIEFLKQLTLKQRATSQQQQQQQEQQKDATSSSSKLVTESDQILTENEELYELRKHVDELKHKLAIREENKSRKYELKCEINELLTKLEDEDVPRQFKTPPETPRPTGLHGSCRVCRDDSCEKECGQRAANWY